jgi:hypothetical protein
VGELAPQTLLDLLQVYETALAELRALRNQGMSGLIARLERHQSQVVAAIADKNSQAVASLRTGAGEAAIP